jgi:small subunit ribosomal protein S5
MDKLNLDIKSTGADNNKTSNKSGSSSEGQQRKRGRREFAKSRQKIQKRRTKKSKRTAEENDPYDSRVINVRRVTRVMKGGKRMRFSALVVVGDKQGTLGYGIKKGLDYQDAVAKATKKAKKNLISIQINEQDSIPFPVKNKYKSAEVFLKPALSGTGLIAGGYMRPILELAGIKNAYTKILGSRNKVVGTQGVLDTLSRFQKEVENTNS